MPTRTNPFEDFAMGSVQSKGKLSKRPGAHGLHERLTGIVRDPEVQDNGKMVDLFFPRSEGFPRDYKDLPKYPLFPNVVHIPKKLFVIGGYLQEAGDAIPDVFSLKLDVPDKHMRWIRMTSLSMRRMHHGSVPINNEEFFTVGGRNASNSALKSAVIFVVPDNKWTNVTDMRHARHQFAISADDEYERVYLLGGYSENQELMDSIEYFSYVLDQWTEIQSPMPIATACHTAVCCEDKIVYMGGITKFGFSKSVFYLDIVDEILSLSSELDQPRAFHCCFLIEKRIVVIGGKHNFQNEGSVSVEYFDKSSKQWITIGDTPRGILTNSVCFVDIDS